jgi:lipopolysaccharide export system permease protein
MGELETDIDSVNREIQNEQVAVYTSAKHLYSYHFKSDSITWPAELYNLKKRRDSIALAKRTTDENYKVAATNVEEIKPVIVLSKKDSLKSDSIYSAPYTVSEISVAVAQARLIKSQLLSHNSNLKAYEFQHLEFAVQWHKILAQSIACIAMFLIGAPLGAIIKKGGLGVPVLMSILFFIVFYVLSLVGEKWAKQATVSVPAGMWMANIILVLIGLLFLRQARADARLFDSDFYSVVWDKISRRFLKKSKA